MIVKKFDDLQREWLIDPEYKREYEALEEEFNLVKELISARIRAKLTQKQIAEKMHTKQSFISKLEGGQHKFNVDTLTRYAKATGSKLEIKLIEKNF